MMKQLPDEANFQYLLEHDQVTREDIEKIASHLTNFYGSATVYNPLHTIYGDVEFVRFNAYENVQQLMPFSEQIGGKDLLKWLKRAAHGFTVRYRNLFAERIRNGFVKNGHGDLRAEHIYLFNGVQVLDCIEFNDRLRFGDVAVDLAFLFMDLCRLGFEGVAHEILEDYCRKSGDYQIWSLLDFYIAYRALVRAKVACLETLGLQKNSRKIPELFKTASRFMQYGIVHTMAYDVPTVIVFMGLPASGKSAHGRRVSKAFQIDHLSSDLIRKEIVPGVTKSPFGEGPYSAEYRNRVYEVLIDRCKNAVKKKRSIVVDATFSSQKWRQRFIEELSDLQCYVLFIETSASVDTLKERLKRREKKLKVTSDARLEHLEGFLKSYVPPNELSADMLIKINTEDDPILVTGKLMQNIFKKRLAKANLLASDYVKTLV